MHKNIILSLTLFVIAFAGVFSSAVKPAQALFSCPITCATCAPLIAQCSENAVTNSRGNTSITNEYITNEFIMQREWMVKVFFEMHILPAMMLFAEQISAMAMHQMVVIGTFFDAKQQLETQRLFQELTARAHKDYHPSEGMCTFGTNVRSLAASDRNMDLSAIAFSNRMRQRELLSGGTLATRGSSSDMLSRLKQFREIYCNPKDNGNGLDLLCPSPMDLTRANKDIDYTRTFDEPLTLKLDLTSEGDEDHQDNTHTQTLSADEEDVFALSANLYAHELAPVFPESHLIDESGVINDEGIKQYMNVRSIDAKRSIATNSFAVQMAMKSQGESEVQPYLYALMKEMGIGEGEGGGGEEDIEKYLGDRPSYYAQMEVLTKKLYQNPTFYTELYDKPANVERKNVSMQAIELMQKRDIYRSILRSEAILSVMLETALIEEQDKLVNEIPKIDPSDPAVELPE